MVHLFMNSESGFGGKPLQLTSFGFQLAEVRGEPGGRVGERDSPGFEGSK